MTTSVQPLLTLSEARIQEELWRAELSAADAAAYGQKRAQRVLICTVVGVAVLGFSLRIASSVLAQVLFYAGPNKRLKLTGGDRSSGSGVLCPGGHGLASNTLAPASESPAA